MVAPDKFKGSLTAAQVARRGRPPGCSPSARVEVRVLPVADGGDGTLDAAVGAGLPAGRRAGHRARRATPSTPRSRCWTRSPWSSWPWRRVWCSLPVGRAGTVGGQQLRHRRADPRRPGPGLHADRPRCRRQRLHRRRRRHAAGARARGSWTARAGAARRAAAPCRPGRVDLTDLDWRLAGRRLRPGQRRRQPPARAHGCGRGLRPAEGRDTGGRRAARPSALGRLADALDPGAARHPRRGRGGRGRLRGPQRAAGRRRARGSTSCWT